MKQVIFFTAKWCTECQSFKPVVESVSKQVGVKLANIDTDYDVSLVEQYNVKSVPTLIVLENGNEIKRLVGSQPENKVKELIIG